MAKNNYLKCLWLSLLLVVAGTARAGDIGEGDISFDARYDQTTGAFKVTIPVYDDDGKDEGLHVNRQSNISVTINGRSYKLCDMYSFKGAGDPQGEANWYWVKIRKTDSTVLSYLEAQGSGSRVQITGSDTEVRNNKSGTMTKVDVYIYLKSEYLTSAATYNVYLYIDKNSGSDYTISKTSTSISALNFPEIKLSADAVNAGLVGKQKFTASVDYNAAGTPYLYFDNDTRTRTSSLSKEYEVENREQTKKITVEYQLDHTKYTRSKSFQVYQYLNVTSLTARNASNGSTQLTWAVPSKSSNSIDVGGFRLQKRVEGGAWSDLTGTLSENTFSFLDESTITQPDKLEFRIFREKPWTEYKPATATIDKTAMRHAQITDFTQARLMAQRNVELTWEWDAGSSDLIVCQANSKFVITREISTDGTNFTDDETIEVSCKDFLQSQECRYTVTVPSSCVLYRWKIYVKPDGNTYLPENAVHASKYLQPKKDEQTGEVLDGVYDENTVGINDKEVASLEYFNASHGYYGDRVELDWKIADNTGSLDVFSIQRREYGNDDSTDNPFVQIGTVETSNGIVYYSYTDTKAVPGVTYEYLIEGNKECANEEVKTQDYSYGFCTPTGNIYGRITFDSENGQAVQDAEVRLETTANIIGKSYRMNGSYFLKVNDAAFQDDAQESFSLQAFVKFDSTPLAKASILQKEDMYELYTEGGNLLFMVGNQLLEGTRSVSELTAVNSFVQVTAVCGTDSLWLYANGDVIGKAPRTTSRLTASGKNFTMGQSLTGYLDEVRVWNKALTTDEVAQTYDRYLSGDEDGLAAYWTFNYATQKEFYDFAHKETKYYMNDGRICQDNLYIDNAQLSDEAANNPSLNQLGYKDYTDSDGSYYIAGIPYMGNGTLYSIIPRLGTHEFSPTKTQVTLSAGSVNHSANFVDKSSFPVSGTITYKGGTIPVEGVQFYVDGVVCSDSKGNIITSDAKGKFTISVPVGTHQVQAQMANHVFENEGKLLDDYGNDINYQDDRYSTVRLTDITTVRYIGRVAGGTVQEDYPVGHSLSKNNLADGITVQLTYENAAYKINDDEMAQTQTLTHYQPGNWKDQGKEPLTNRVTTFGNVVTIFPNATTGEFVADLLPINYAIKVNVPGYSSISGNNSKLSLTDAFVEQYSTNDYADSMLVKKQFVVTEYKDTVRYNKMQKFIARVKPTVNVQQMEGSTPLPFFGDSVSTVMTADGNATAKLYNQDTDTYTLGLPVFSQSNSYTLSASVYEEYPYYDESGNVVTDRLSDKVPSGDATVSFQTTMRSSNDYEEVEVDSTGVAKWTFTASKVDMTTATANINVKAVISADDENTATSIAWISPFDANNLVIMKGSVSKGNNFITAGPDKVLAVLRDPPGSASYSYLEKGTTFSESSTYTGGVTQEGSEEIQINVGTELVTFTGIGVGTIQSATQTNAGVVSFEHSEEWENEQTKTSTTTINTYIQTSEEEDYVGAMADVFVGYSTNLSFGSSDIVTLVAKDYYDANADGYKGTYDAGQSNEYVLAQTSALEAGTQFATMFMYPQVYITKYLLPNMEEVRNSLLRTQNEMSEARFQAEANSTGKPIYVSYLDASNENYGKSNIDPVFRNDPKWYQNDGQSIWDGPSYKIYYPADIALKTDTIQTLNQSMEKWIERMADNERAKVEAINSGEPLENYSLQAGASIEYSREYSNVDNTTNSFSIVIGVGGGTDFDVNILGSGCKFEFEENVNTSQGGSFSSESEATTKTGFVLADGGNDYFTVDVYQEPGGDNEDADADDIDSKDLKLSTFIFYTRAGATSCPYEDEEVTQYYQPGTVISEKTLQIEKPEIAVENAFIDNVPSGEPAYVTLYLRNNSEINESLWFDLIVDDRANQLGAGLKMDGGAIGNGRTIMVNAGETLTKVLEVTKGPGLNYDDLQLVLASQCQGDPTANFPVIADTVTFSVHFTPSCSDVSIKTPSDNWTYNTDMPTQKNEAGIDVHYMNVEISDFNVNYDNFKSIKLMYKPSSNSDENWITLMNYYNNEEYYNEAVENGMNAEMIKAEDQGTITYQWFLDDMPDQQYDLCAATVCVINNVEVENFSPVHSGTKDMYRPTLFGQPQPANGILTIEDEVKITFNESIAAGYLTDNNFSVTGIKNGTTTSHSVAVETDGNTTFSSEMTRSFRGKDLTIEAWVKLPADQDATIFHHGTETDLDLSFGITSQRQLTARINGKTYTSEVIAFTDYLNNWNHVAMTLEQSEDESATGKLTLYFNFVSCLEVSGIPAYTGNAAYVLAEGLRGQIHNVRIWTTVRTSGQLQTQSNQLLSGNEENLLSYYPMDEARGTVLKDKSRGLNLAMSGGTWVLPEGRATTFNGSNSFLKFNSGSSVVIDTDGDYTMELWFKGDYANADAALLASGRADGSDWGGSENLFRLGFEGGLLSYRSNGQLIQANGDYLDDNWHHVAVSVNRITNRVQLYVDGALAAYAEATGYGRIASAYIYAGVTPIAINSVTNTYVDYFHGEMDDVRFWGLYKNEASVAASMCNRLDGTEMGLLSYYPFEIHTVTSQNIPVVRYSLADAKVVDAIATPNVDATAVIGEREFASITTDLREMLEDAFMTEAIAPVRDKGGVTDLLFDFVVNNDALIITLKEEADKIEKTTVTFTVTGVRDLNGNSMASNAITWTAYIDRNQLRWGDDELYLSKEVDEPLTFTVEATNRGGYTESYTISNYPSWMDVEPSSGTLTATKSQNIQFTVDESLNIGTYNETVYLTNSEGVSEPLNITLKVNGQQPAWTVNPADYKYSMNIYGKLRINGYYSNDTEDLLAAFQNDVCTGVAANQYIKLNDMYYVLLTVYSNEASTDTLEFKMWDASTGTTYVASPAQRITFKANTIVGTPTAPVEFTNLDLKQLDLKLNAGWTWTSFNVTNEKMKDISATLANNSWQNGDEIKREDGGMATYGSKTGWVSNGLDAFEPEGMYLINSSVAQTVSVIGTPIDVTQNTITVRSVNDQNVAVWNYLPYWSQQRLTLAEALSGYDALEGDVLKSQNSFAMYTNRLGWIGSLTYMQPGLGYMLQRTGTTATTLQYPSEAVSSNRIPTRATEDEDFDIGEPNRNYVRTMSLLATVEGIDATEGDVLRIYADGEYLGQSPVVCRDEAGRPLFFISIAGDSERPFDAVLERNGEILGTSGAAGTFVADRVSGSFQAPTVISFNEAGAAGVYPSPFTDVLNIRRTVEADARVNVRITSIDGNTVAIFHDCADQGIVDIHWKGAAAVSAGVYLVNIETNGESEVIKVMKK